MKNKIKLIALGITISVSAGLCCGDLTPGQLQAAQQIVKEMREDMYLRKNEKIYYVKELIDKGITLSDFKTVFQYNEGKTTLHEELNRFEQAQKVESFINALSTNDEILVKLYVEKFPKAYINLTPEEKTCILFLVLDKEYDNSLKALLNFKLHLKGKGSKGNIFHAVLSSQENKIARLNMLLNHIKKWEQEDIINIIAAQDEDGRTPLHWAVGLENIEALNTLLKFIENLRLDQKGIISIINIQNRKKLTPLNEAVSFGKISIVKLFWENNNWIQNLDKNAIAKQAIECKHSEIAFELLPQEEYENLLKEHSRQQTQQSKISQDGVSLWEMTSAFNGGPITRTAKKKSKQANVILESEKISKETEEFIPQSIEEPYHGVFFFTPNHRSTILDDGKYKEGIKTIISCIDALRAPKESTNKISFKFDRVKKNELKLSKDGIFPDFALEFFNSHQKPNVISSLHGTNKICTDHINDIVSYLIHFMCLAVEVDSNIYSSCFDLLMEFDRCNKLNTALLQDLYPGIPWNENTSHLSYD